MQNEKAIQLWLLRHGETEWSLSGAHTSRTDISLTERGREQALTIGKHLNGRRFSTVLTSPMQRAQETCRLAGLADYAHVEANLCEWDYGLYEGRTTAEIRRETPGWSVWTGHLPQGETVDEVGMRAQAVIDRCLSVGGTVALFAHAHILRILTAVWLELAPAHGRLFALETGSLSKLGGLDRT
ncbi:histidine phosphatase family protein [Acidipila sp. EB88]|uniref:histidine phosphatase family protein n=1 Tax=Acidipila sp. EB88 TaxID=2305226 RepID=UPI000F5ECB25|nr:histidine phosphatase family protein [Acidipila sp. EB88]RRA50429.1 histidine phosphatase family protein [Acidipila sp. EB88]